MEPADGVACDVVTTRRDHWRGALIGVGTAIAAGLLVLLAPSPAHADDGRDGGIVGGLVSELSGVVDGLVDEVVVPVVAPLPPVREVPVVGKIVGGITDAHPVQGVTEPVAGVVDGLLGDTVGSLPLVGELLGDKPVAGILDPLAGTVDSAVAEVVGTVGAPVSPGGDGPVIRPPDGAIAASVLPVFLVSDAFASALPVVSSAVTVGDLVTGAITGGGGFSPGAPGFFGDATIVGAAGAGPTSPALAVLGAGSLILLLAGRARLEALRAPPSPSYDTDSSPD